MKTTRKNAAGVGPFVSNLTDAQQTELWGLITSLREQHATFEMMSAAIYDKLDEFGRQKGLRAEGYSRMHVKAITQDDDDHRNMTNIDPSYRNDFRFHHGPRGGSDDFLPPEESDQ